MVEIQVEEGSLPRVFLSQFLFTDARQRAHNCHHLLPLPNSGKPSLHNNILSCKLFNCTMRAGKATLDAIESQLHPVLGAICASLSSVSREDVDWTLCSS